MVKNVNVYGKVPKMVGDSEIISFEDMSYFLYNDMDVTLGTCELYVNVEPYILITTFANNVEAKQFIQQHSEDIKSAIITIGSAEVKYIKRKNAIKKKQKEVNNDWKKESIK